MKKIVFVVLALIFALGIFSYERSKNKGSTAVATAFKNESYWFVLNRKSNVESLYFGVPGEISKSGLVRTFNVKAGIPGEKPTPLPQNLGKEFWLITDKFEDKENPETAPYFLTLNVPVSEESPYGPTPYLECNGSVPGETKQCDWELPGYFGLHGINADASRLSDENPGSSGCVRHKDEDITYLYNLLDPKKEEVRYYVEDI